MKTLLSKFLTILPVGVGMASASMLAASMLFSCSAETALDDAPRASSDTEATFVVSAAAQSHPATRAIDEGGAEDNEVREITVLLFDTATGEYRRFVRTASLQTVPTGTGNENRWKFSAKFPVGSYQALFLANAAALIDSNYDLAAGTVKQGGGDMTALTIDAIERALARDLDGKYDADPKSAGYTPFVMSSGREAVTVPFGSADRYLNNPVRLARDVAKINVRFASKEVSDRFEIEEIRLCNRSTVSFAVGTPALWNLWNSGANVTEPLFATGVARQTPTVISGCDETTSIIYKKDKGEIVNNQCVDEIFTPERTFVANVNDNVCLLVRGNVTLGGVKRDDRWYKLAFLRRDASGTLRNVNILRNHVYTMNILAVSDPGYDRPEDAYAEQPGNLVVDLTADHEEGLNNVVYNGQYYLAVTKTEYEFSCISELEQELKIYTDYPGGWKIDPVPAGWEEWLTQESSWTAGASGPKDLTAAGNLRPKANVRDAAREFTFTVTAGSLSQRITVRQKPNAYIFATPGVVGIKLSDYRRLMNVRAHNNNPAWLDPSVELSIKGSSTYAGTIVDNPGALADFGGALESEPVYSVYTMFGSTIAVLMGGNEKWENDGRRVVWTNLEYEGTTVGPWMNSATFVPATVDTNNTDYNITDDPAKGHGDICRAISNGAYRIPRGNPWQLADGTAPFGTDPMDDDKWWELAESPAKFWSMDAANAPYVGVGNNAMLADKNETIFLPAAGSVVDKSGTNNTMGEYVIYRTSTVSGTGGAFQLLAFEWSFSPRAIGTPRTGLPVRCVKAAKPTVVPPKPPLLLSYVGTTLPAAVPQEGGKWQITAKTNLPTWGIRVYEIKADNSRGALLREAKNLAGSPSDQNNTEFTEFFAVPRNDGAEPRKLAFYLYSEWYDKDNGEVFAVERAQEAALTLPQTGFPAPPGVLGVTPSGELTLRGSALYKGTVVEQDSPFGPVHEEAVFVAYFRWGSLVAINSTSNPDSENGENALISNGDQFDFSDFDWIHPDYSYGGQKGGKALKALLGSGKTSTEMWSTLPMNGALNDWLPANTAAAQGDPCPYATVDAAKTKAAGWHLPSGKEGWNGIPSGSLESRLVADNVKLTNGWVVKGRRDKNEGTNGWGMFLPYAGLRQQSGQVSGRGLDGTYWSATRAGASGGNYLATGSGSVGTAPNANNMGMPIRCVGGTPAAPAPTVPTVPTLSGKRTYGWGQYNNTAGYIMQPSEGGISSGTRKIVDAPINFGTDAGSAVKIERFSSTSTFNHSLLTGGDAYDPAKVKEMFDTKPDIVLTGFDIDVTDSKQAEVAGYMLDYLKDGGTLVLALEHPGLLKAFIEALYPNATIDIIWKTTNTFQIAYVGDEITNGTFGNIGGRYWGNDANGTRAIVGMPEDDVVVYSRDEDGNPVMFRHKKYNLMFIGDGGAFANYNGESGENGGTTAVTTHPLAFDSNGRPITRTGWMTGNSVENGRLFANIMTWAVRQAETNGINKK